MLLSSDINVYLVKKLRTAFKPFFRTESTTAKYAAKRNTLTITTAVVPSTCLRLGHVTRRISSFKSFTYSLVPSIQTLTSAAINLPSSFATQLFYRVTGRGGGIRTPTRCFGD